MLPREDFMERIEKLRIRYGKPMRVTSAARCPEYNAAVSSTGGKGPHTTGRAIDIGVDRGDAYMVLKLALEAGFTGIGVAQKGSGRFMHLDDLLNDEGQPRPTIWSY
jgi:uncharacterized protein YcbK (DUF882 family)